MAGGGRRVNLVVFRLRAVAAGSVLAASLLTSFGFRPSPAAGAEAAATPRLTAYLDGKPIPLADVSRYYCDDFDYPVIQCSVSPLVETAKTELSLLATSVDYVTIFDNSLYGGAWMNVSADYGVLALIGWNDRISSFKARNGETGRFFVDWLYSGSQWSFCCNTWQPSLGGYDNTFSSIQRT